MGLRAHIAATGQVISEDNRLSLALNRDLSQQKEERVYVRIDPGYTATNLNAELIGGNANKWQMAADNNGVPGTYGDWGASIGLGDITTERLYFWVRAKSDVGESVGHDDVYIDVDAIVGIDQASGVRFEVKKANGDPVVGATVTVERVYDNEIVFLVKDVDGNPVSGAQVVVGGT